MANKRNLIARLAISVFSVAMACGIASGEVIYVDDDASVGGNGQNWDTAFKYLQDGLAAVSYGDEIRVAQGVYIPDQNSVNPGGTGIREETFQLINGVVLKGGYAGAGEPEPNDRDVEAYETILSGDLAGNDGPDFANNGENSYHVTVGSGTDPNTVLNGLTITAGNADGSYPKNTGGGMYSLSGSPMLTNCTFSSNSAAAGGGMYNKSGMPILTNCIFIGNSAGSDGGGMCNDYDCSPTLINCTFIGNFAHNGGGIYDHQFLGTYTLINCVFIGNLAGGDGGGIFNEHSAPTMTNCTFTGNSAGDTGGGIYWLWENYGGYSTTLTNCILWDNSANEGPQIAVSLHYNISISYCDIQGGQVDISTDDEGEINWLGGNIGEDLVNDNPLFVDLGYWDMSTWVDGDYHLQSRAGRWDAAGESWVTDDVNSPCIDAGDPNSDWSAELWPHGKLINMGAFGGTPQASMSESPAGNIADLDANDVVNYTDLELFTDGWLRQQVLLSEDLDRDGSVKFKDFAIFAGEWFWEE